MKAFQVHEGTLYKLLRVFFPNENIHVNVKKLFNIKSPVTGQYLECDVWVHEHELCFEFQDSHHYVATWYNHNTHETTQNKDIVKEALVKQKGLTLVIIPCWWDGSPESLAATIQFHRPDLAFSVACERPISLNPLTGYLDSVLVPEVGELMLASFPPERFSVPRNTWWMGEKYDGVRCCWVPSENTAYTRYGKFLSLQPILENSMPPIVLDCELWYGRGQFALSFQLVRATIVSHWDALRVLSFDASSYGYQSRPFEERYSLLLASVLSDHPFAIVAPRVVCKGDVHVKEIVDAIIGDGGEGAILRRIGSLYEPGRSHSLIKIKNSIGDKEAIVTGVGEDKALELTLPNGISFTVPPQDVHIATPKKGDVVSFTYQGFARRDVPVGPIVFRIRTDVLWEDLVQSEVSEKKKSGESYSARPIRHWSAQNMRKFFEKYALSIHSDPLLAQTWYKTSSETIRLLKGGAAILAKFKGGYYHAIQHLFPEIVFDKTVLHGYMIHDVRNRRKFFEDFARERGFDPNDPEHWYLQARKSITSVEGGVSALIHSKGGFIDSISHLFPEIGVQNRMFIRDMWREEGNRRKFFELYAKQRSFDPLVAENWYQQSVESFMSIKGARRIVRHHKDSVFQALLDLFPNIGLDRSKFVDQTLWQDAEKRREFFVLFARDNSFDPLLPSNWYLQPRELIMSQKGAQGVVFHHDNSLSNALIELFPNIGLDHDKFQLSRWHDARNRKQFFENYAKENGFDPLDPCNWTPRVRKSLLSVKAVKKIISYHNNSVTKALLELFPNIGWKANKIKSMYRDIRARKLFLERYAKENGFDPSNPENWYSRYFTRTFTEKNAPGVVYFHDNNLPKALAELFPNIGINKSKFVTPKPTKLWRIVENRREFFEKYAFNRSFEPLVAENWYLQSPERILSVKGGRSIILHHNASLLQALMDLFPDIGLDATKFPVSWFGSTRKSEETFSHNSDPMTPKISMRMVPHRSTRSPIKSMPALPTQVISSPSKQIRKRRSSRLVQKPAQAKKKDKTKGEKSNQAELPLRLSVASVKRAHGLVSSSYSPALESPTFPKNLWRDEKKRRKFFEDYARDEGFDALVPENWYSQIKTIMTYKGARSVIALYNHSVSTALLQLFPDIGLAKEKFTQPWWHDSGKRRAFLEHFARMNGFDPLVPDNWYSITRDRILAFKGGRGALKVHVSVRNAAMALFPDIGLQRAKFHRPSAKWYNPEDRRRFFESYARSKGFDALVPDSWYKVSREQIISFKGAKGILTYHRTFAEALINLFPDIAFEKSKLFVFTAKWRDPAKQREFFLNFAKSNGFDPLVAAHWYSQKRSKILSAKGGPRVVAYHSGRVGLALLTLFPHISFDQHRLPF